MAATKKTGTTAKKPGIDKNVWSRFDDDGYGIYNVQPPKKTGGAKKATTGKKKK